MLRDVQGSVGLRAHRSPDSRGRCQSTDWKGLFFVGEGQRNFASRSITRISRLDMAHGFISILTTCISNYLQFK